MYVCVNNSLPLFSLVTVTLTVCHIDNTNGLEGTAWVTAADKMGASSSSVTFAQQLTPFPTYAGRWPPDLPAILNENSSILLLEDTTALMCYNWWQKESLLLLLLSCSSSFPLCRLVSVCILAQGKPIHMLPCTLHNAHCALHNCPFGQGKTIKTRLDINFTFKLECAGGSTSVIRVCTCPPVLNNFNGQFVEEAFIRCKLQQWLPRYKYPTSQPCILALDSTRLTQLSSKY